MQAKLPNRYIVVHHNGASLPITNHHYTQPCHPNFLFEKNLCRELSVSQQNFTAGQIRLWEKLLTPEPAVQIPRQAKGAGCGGALYMPWTTQNVQLRSER